MNKTKYKKEIEEAIQDESPYCEICGTCGCIGCCGIRNFISEHIEGKTNCKNEGWIISELINLCEYKDKVFSENKEKDKEIKRLNNIIKRFEEDLREMYITFGEFSEEYTENKLKELKEKSDKKCI